MKNMNCKVVFLLIAILSLAPFALGQSYTLTNLGTLRPGSARVHDINSQGQIVGGSGYPHGSNTHAFLWTKKAGMKDLGFLPGGDYSVAIAINDAGQIVGTSNSTNGMHGFLWTNANGLTQLPSLQGTSTSSAYAINQSGQIAGASGSHAALWTENSVKDLGALSGAWSEAHGLNNAGQVVGVADTPSGSRAFLWANGSGMKDLGVLPGDSSSRANHISDQGEVVGASEGMAGVRAFLWTNSAGMRALASLPSGGYSEAFGVNSLGQVVGQSGSSLGTRAVLWSGGSVTDLNDLVPDLPVGTILTGAFSINDEGQIVAFGVSSPNLNKNRQARMDDHLHSGPTHVYLLTPQSTSTAP
jgi:probable HAF family extracellular repeat protein